MADIFSVSQRSAIMRSIKGSNTKPEILVRKYLFSTGLRFRIHQKSLPGNPDVVLKKHNVVILVNGCFWHAHQNCRIFKMPLTRQDYWRSKFERNKRNDKKNIRELKELGWRVITVWECQLAKDKREETLRKLYCEIILK